MKVFEINSVCGIRSTGRICTDLADLLKEYGHECRIAYGRETVPDKYKDVSYRIGSDADVKRHALASRLFDCSAFCSKKATQALTEEIDDYRPDVVHLHNLHGYYLDVETLFEYLAAADIPVVWTLHDCWAFTGHCAYFSAAECDRWKNGCHDCPQKGQYPASLFADRSRQNWEKKRALFTGVKNMTIVTPSEWLAGLVNASFLGKYPVKVIRNGIDLEAFKPTASDFRERYGLQGKTLILGVATAWSERKGLAELRELSSLLDDRYRLVLLGLPERWIRTLPEKVVGLPVTDTVEELAGIYTEADVFVNASKEETMGLTTVEAMACGTPVVVSNLTAVPEVVTPESGVVVKELTAVELKKGIERVLGGSFDPRSGAQAYEKRQQYLRYLEVYTDVLGWEKKL